MPQNKITSYWPLVLGLALVISTIIFSQVFYVSRSTTDALSVVGSAKQRITSDQVKWTTQYTRTAYESDLRNGYAAMSRDQAIVKQFYVANGIAEADLSFSPVYLEQIYRQDAGPKEYTLRQTVTVNSTDVAKIDALSKNIQSVANQGVIFSTQNLEYTYSKLADLRISLLGEALKDARARANSLAETSGSKLGKLQAASSGVVQVLPLNSIDVSDYGAYDTQNIEKEVMVTVRASFSVK